MKYKLKYRFYYFNIDRIIHFFISFRSFAIDKNSSSNVMTPPQNSKNILMFSQALGRAYPVLAALCFLKHDSTSLLPRPREEKQGEVETFGATLSTTYGVSIIDSSSSS